MEVTLLCSDINHPIYPYLESWKKKYKDFYNVSIVGSVKEITQSGDFLFLISCSEVVKRQTREMFMHTLVLHASDLPEGRGWSPHIWDVISAKDKLTVSLLNAADSVDTGDIWKKKYIKLKGSELYDEINDLVFEAEIDLITWACENIKNSKPTPQKNLQSKYYRKRTPADSELDISKSISEQFDLLRVCDATRFPAFFEIRGQKFKLIIERFYEE